jgi:hypothetical protein
VVERARGYGYVRSRPISCSSLKGARIRRGVLVGVQDAAELDTEMEREAVLAVVQIDPGDGLDAAESVVQR